MSFILAIPPKPDHVQGDGRGARPVHTGLPKNYASPDLDKRVLGDVVDLFTNMDMRETEGNRDVLGRTYEYRIAQFAEKEGR